MMLCYSLGIFIIVTVIIGMIVLNIFLLQQQIIGQVESTRDDEANEDLLNLAKVGSQFVYSEVYKGILSMRFLQNILIDMFREETFSLKYSDDQFEFKDLNSTDIETDEFKYGNHSVCFKYPTYYYINQDAVDNLNLKQKVSRFVYIFEELFRIYSYSALRYTLYFEETEFVLFYPGNDVEYYDPKETIWYKEFMLTENTTTTRSYSDGLGNEDNQILSVAIPLYNSTDGGHRIGVLCGDWLIRGLYRLMENITYLGNGRQYLIYKDGNIVDNKHNPWIKPGVGNLVNLTYCEYWPEILDSPTDIHYLIEDGEIWRTATALVIEDPSSYTDNWDFILILVVKESDVMSYKQDAKNLIGDEGMKFILIAIGCSLITTTVILCFINFQANSISRPIQGIIDFTYKLNTEEDDSIENELHQLEEGTDQTSKLILAYKELARSLINRKNINIKQEEIGKREFPPNELYRIDKSTLMKNIEFIPHFYGK